MTTATRRYLHWAQEHASAMRDTLRAFVEIESPSTDAEQVAVFAGSLARELGECGFVVELAPVPGTGPLLLAKNTDKPRPILLFGHLDTVWPVGALRARPVTIEGDLLYGPGAYDMKGGLVVALFALRALKDAGDLPPLAFLATPSEETGGEAYRERMETEMRASQAVLCFEPAWPGGAVKTSRKGSGSLTLRARGRAAHAGADFDRGRNAILALARVVLEASALTDLDRGVTVNVGVFRGGVRPNIVPDFAEAEIDFRIRTVDDGLRIAAAIENLRSPDPEIPIEIEGGLHYPPLERTPQVVAVYRKARAVAAEIGMDLGEVATGGAGEAAFASALGLPTLDGLGPDGDGAHAEHEHVLLSSLPERVALAAGLIVRLAQEASTPSP